MAAVSVWRVITFSVLSCLTLASFAVLCQLFTGFYCPKTTRNPRNTGQTELSVPTTSAHPDKSMNKSTESSTHHSNPSGINNEPPETPSISPFFKRNTTATCVIFTLGCLAATADHLHKLKNPQRDGHPFLRAVLPLYFIGHILLSLIFIGRLYFTFIGSVFAYSNCTMRALFITWFSMIICTILAIITGVALDTVVIRIMFGVAVILIDFVLSWVLMYLYAKKLHKIMASGDEYLTNIVTKYALLYAVCFTSTLLMILSSVAQLVEKSVTNRSSLPLEDFTFLVALDSFANCVCLWLNLASADPWYYVLCRWGDQQCKKCCVSVTKNTEQNESYIMDNVVKGEIASGTNTNKAVMNVTVESAGGNQAIIL